MSSILILRLGRSRICPYFLINHSGQLLSTTRLLTNASREILPYFQISSALLFKVPESDPSPRILHCLNLADHLLDRSPITVDPASLVVRDWPETLISTLEKKLNCVLIVVLLCKVKGDDFPLNSLPTSCFLRLVHIIYNYSVVIN